MLGRKERILAAGQDEDRSLHLRRMAANRDIGDLAKDTAPDMRLDPVQFSIHGFGKGGV